MDEPISYTQIWHDTRYRKLITMIYIFVLNNTIKFSVSQLSGTDCVLNFQILSSTNNSSCERGEWGGFLNNNCCGGAFGDYLYALGKRANQTGKIFLDKKEQRDCLTAEGKIGEGSHVLGCGIEKLTRGGGGCSDFAVDDVNSRLGNELRSLEESCKFQGPDEEGNQLCSSCVRAWKDIRGTHSNENGEVEDGKSDICRFAVLVTLTSSRIEDQMWIRKVYKCLGEQDSDRGIQEGRSSRNSKIISGKHVIIGSVVGIAVVGILLASILLKKRHKSNVTTKKDGSKSVLPKKSAYLKLSVKEVYAATNNLNASNFIGEGTAGKVYKGILSNKQHVAVKHIINDGHAETFLREVRSLSHVRHPNLVALLGYCENEDEFFLVYELCPNGNLSEWLFGRDKVLTWIQRLEIAISSARGLWFLHTYPEGCIVHRDIKAKFVNKGSSIVKFADPKLVGEYSSQAFDLTFNLALSCTSLKQQRPSMEQVVLTLEEALHLSTMAKVSTPTRPELTSTP
ncbi:hypothetical protein Acr_00g0040100 [Actinidia rufa]|uniref:non-specific serine/threonine protein kinase n=1 Tax=Actinidia rufa TaxID=165716 RepID=A0A7J0DHR6_9ERIC|nr:hypothetical protein Acr_00g0040100 [Actinidia rufa]